MEKYHRKVIYKKIGLGVSILVINLQLITVFQFLKYSSSITPILFIIIFFFAYVFTDFINGLVHMFMDNNTHYTSLLGPFIAAFHLHHVTPKYSDKPVYKIYFHESGTKIWLAFYLLILVILQHYHTFSPSLNFGLVSVGVLSSFAEVSHFWCHNSKNACIQFLQKNKILLSKQHHIVHHVADNKNYAFLNGVSDPVINWIAHRLYSGYKQHADQHAKAYKGIQTNNRG